MKFDHPTGKVAFGLKNAVRKPSMTKLSAYLYSVAFAHLAGPCSDWNRDRFAERARFARVRFLHQS